VLPAHGLPLLAVLAQAVDLAVVGADVEPTAPHACRRREAGAHAGRFVGQLLALRPLARRRVVDVHAHLRPLRRQPAQHVDLAAPPLPPPAPAAGTAGRSPSTSASSPTGRSPAPCRARSSPCPCRSSSSRRRRTPCRQRRPRRAKTGLRAAASAPPTSSSRG